MRKNIYEESGWTIFPSLNVRATIMESGRAFKDSFTAKADRPLDLYLVI
jgi:hypothetical protein